MIKKLSSGAELVITVGSFAESKALYQALIEECKSIKIQGDSQTADMIKDLFCVGLSSKKIEAALAACLKRVTYKGLKIDENTFEPIENREDYIELCLEVIHENIAPFWKSLYAQFNRILVKLEKSPA